MISVDNHVDTLQQGATLKPELDKKKQLKAAIDSVLALLPESKDFLKIKDAVKQDKLPEAMELLEKMIGETDYKLLKSITNPFDVIKSTIVQLKGLKGLEGDLPTIKIDDLTEKLNEIVMTGGSKRTMRKTSKRKNKKSKLRKTKYIGGVYGPLTYDETGDVLLQAAMSSTFYAFLIPVVAVLLFNLARYIV